MTAAKVAQVFNGRDRLCVKLLLDRRRTGPRTKCEPSEVLKCTPRNSTGLVDAPQAAGFVQRAPHRPTGAPSSFP